MSGAALLRDHTAHFVVFGVPVAILVGMVAWQEIRARLRDRSNEDAGDAIALRRPTADLWVAVVGLTAAAVIHAVVFPEHLREYALFGVFFAALAIAQCWVAVLLIRRSDPRTVLYVAIASAWVVALWVVSRTTGLPVGREPWRPESLGRLDAASSCAELITAVACLRYFWSIGGHRRSLEWPLPELTR